MTNNMSNAAASARENARAHDGKFGPQAHAEADLDLQESAASSPAARYAKAAAKLVAEVEEAGYEIVIGRRPDKPHRGTSKEPVVRISLWTPLYVGRMEIAGDTGHVQRSFMGDPVDEFPAMTRFRRPVFYATLQQYRDMDKFVVERAEQIAEINRLSATGLTDAPQLIELYS